MRREDHGDVLREVERAADELIGLALESQEQMESAEAIGRALGGVDFVDLDTAWLLADDPYTGGYEASGPHVAMPASAGLGVQRLQR